MDFNQDPSGASINSRLLWEPAVLMVQVYRDVRVVGRPLYVGEYEGEPDIDIAIQSSLALRKDLISLGTGHSGEYILRLGTSQSHPVRIQVRFDEADQKWYYVRNA